jgi:kynurenine formamidase
VDAGGAAGGRRVVDLSHPITEDIEMFDDVAAPRVTPVIGFDASHAVYDHGTEFSIEAVTLAGTTGTQLHTPAHRYRGGEDVGGIGLERLADLPALVIPATDRQVVGADLFAGLDVAGRAVLIATGHDRWWGSDLYTVDHPYLDEAAGELLADGGAALVGIDSLDVDATDAGTRPVHSVLLSAGIPIVEHLTGLVRLPATGARFSAAPPRIVGMGTFPVRAFAVVDG